MCVCYAPVHAYRGASCVKTLWDMLLRKHACTMQGALSTASDHLPARCRPCHRKPVCRQSSANQFERPPPGKFPKCWILPWMWTELWRHRKLCQGSPQSTFQEDWKKPFRFWDQKHGPVWKSWVLFILSEIWANFGGWWIVSSRWQGIFRKVSSVNSVASRPQSGLLKGKEKL